MKTSWNRFKALFALLIVLATTLAVSQAAEKPSDAEKIMKNILAAIESGSQEQFARDGDDNFKKTATQDIVNNAKALHGERLKHGFKTKYLADLKQQGCQVYLWKVTLKDGGDDLLLRLASSQGKVVGFFIQ